MVIAALRLPLRLAALGRSYYGKSSIRVGSLIGSIRSWACTFRANAVALAVYIDE